MKTFALLVGVLLLSSCAPPDWSVEEEGAFDPIEPINRAVYGVNQKLDWAFLTPAARVYSNLPPQFLAGFGNAFDNLQEPANIANNILQRRGDEAATSFARFVVNSTAGAGGLFDFAAEMDIARQEADFDQTLRSYGAQYGDAKIRNTALGKWLSGFGFDADRYAPRLDGLSKPAYIVLPLAGPSSLTGAVGNVADSALSPIVQIDDKKSRAIIGGVAAIDRREELLEASEIVGESALDEYTFVRDVYEDRRRASAVENKVWGR